MFGSLLLASIVCFAPAPNDREGPNPYEAGRRIGRLEVLMTWADTLLKGKDDDEWKKTKRDIDDLIEAAKKGRMTKDQFNSFGALEVNVVGVIEVIFATTGDGTIPKAFRELKEKMKKEWEAEKKK